MRNENAMEPNTAEHASPETFDRKQQRPHKFRLVLGVLALALSAYTVAGALWGTTDNSFFTAADLLLWVSLPAGLLGVACIALHALVRRRRSIT
jgi:hypothetical protein